MKKRRNETKKLAPTTDKKIEKAEGPSLYEAEYLNQIVEELKIFLKSKNVTTMNDVYLGFRGGNYRGQILLSKGAS